MPIPLKILIVEDSQDDADLVLRELRRAGFDPKWKRVETESAFLAELKSLPDIILSDYSMPEFNGLRAAKLLKESNLDIPFILISGTVGEDVAVEAMQHGATDYLIKDRIARLGPAVQRALEETQLRKQRQQAEEELRLIHEKLRHLLEHNPAVLYTLKIEGENIVPVIVSESIQRLLGYTVAESARYEWWLENLHPEDRDRAVATLGKALTGDGYLMEYRIRHKDGGYRWVEDNNRVLRGADGKPNFMVGVWADISERKHAEEVLRKTSRQATGRKKNRVLWDLIVIFGLGALSFVFLWFTDVLEAPFNKLASMFTGNFDDLFLTPTVLILGFLIFAYRRWRDAQSQVGEQANIQEALRKLHGELEKRIQQRTGELSRANETLRSEIAERQRAEEAMRDSEMFLNTIIEKIPHMIFVKDANELRFVNFNKAGQELLGYSLAELAGKNDYDLFPKELADHFTDKDREVLRGTEVVDIPEEAVKTRHKGERILHTRKVPILNAKGKPEYLLGISEDITGRKKLEEQFRQSQKMEGVGQLAGGVAHDFNNILAVIQMQSDLLKGDGGLSQTQLEMANDIGAATQRAAALTRQLLLFSRKQTLKPRDLDFNASINDMTKLLRRTLGENIELQFKFAMRPLFIHADAGMMDQVLMNLAVNARDAMPEGGKLVIETFAVEFDESVRGQSTYARPGSFVCLSVSDTGCGIPHENLLKIFEPFFTTKEAGKGTGLGLATVFGIVQQHQGWINVYSEAGRGTTFRIYLPRLEGMSGQKQEQPTLAAMRGGNETILFVEDDAFLRASIRKAMVQLGYRVLEAVSGAEALDVWNQHRDEIRLLLTDLVLPGGINGIELAGQLLDLKPDLKVIYASGYSAEVTGKDFPLEEGVNFLTKPFEAHKLAQTVRNRLDHI